MQRWPDLPEKTKKEIERKYRSGKSPVILGVEYGLKPKQISDQAYRKSWTQISVAQNPKAVKKSLAKGSKDDTKKSSRKKTAKKQLKKPAKKTLRKRK